MYVNMHLREFSQIFKRRQVMFSIFYLPAVKVTVKAPFGKSLNKFRAELIKFLIEPRNICRNEILLCKYEKLILIVIAGSSLQFRITKIFVKLKAA